MFCSLSPCILDLMYDKSSHSESTCLRRGSQWLDVRLWLADFLWPVHDLWLTGDHCVDKLSAVGQPTRPIQPSIPLEVGNRVVIHVITWITGVETTKRQTRLHMAVWLQVRVRWRGLGLQHTLFTCSVTHSTTAVAVCGSWRCTSVIP